MFYSSAGSRLFAATLGDGPDVVLLHPTPVSHGFWEPAAVELSGRYRLTLPDLRGHGQSEAGQGIVGMDQLGADVERLLDAVGIGHAIFAGCSIGSYVLYELWRRMPQRVDALAFCCGKPQPDAAATRAKRWETIENIRLHGPGSFYDQVVDTLVTPTFRSCQPAKAAELRAMMNTMEPETAIAIQQDLMERPDSVPTVPTITVPVLALAAAHDPASTPEEMSVIAELLPAAEYHLIPQCGHFAPYEQPQVVSRILGKFFARVSL